MNSCAATSRYVAPAATRPAICSSWGSGPGVFPRHAAGPFPPWRAARRGPWPPRARRRAVRSSPRQPAGADGHQPGAADDAGTRRRGAMCEPRRTPNLRRGVGKASVYPRLGSVVVGEHLARRCGRASRAVAQGRSLLRQPASCASGAIALCRGASPLNPHQPSTQGQARPPRDGPTRDWLVTGWLSPSGHVSRRSPSSPVRTTRSFRSTHRARRTDQTGSPSPAPTPVLDHPASAPG